MKLLKIGLGATHGDSKVAAVIIRATAPLSWIFSSKKLFDVPNHIFIWFEDEAGERVYFEALEGKGWQGPFPVADVQTWQAEQPDKRWAHFYDLSVFFSTDDIQESYDHCVRMLDFWTYNLGQLGLMLRSASGLRRFVKSSPNAVICSEAGSRICHNRFLDLREWTGAVYHDYQNPREIEEACKELLRKNPVKI